MIEMEREKQSGEKGCLPAREISKTQRFGVVAGPSGRARRAAWGHETERKGARLEA
jgi:hypothetical protein